MKDNQVIEHDNIFYLSHISQIGGIETFIYEMAKKYANYDIAIVSKIVDNNQRKRLKKYCPVYLWKGQKIKCKTIVINYDNSILDHVEAETICETIHADYTNPLYKIYPEIDKRVDHWLGITKHICKTFDDKFGVKTELCYNPLTVEKKDKPLVLVSATRLSPIKGKDRMIRLAEELDKANIDYVWYIFTTDTGGINNDNVIYRKPTLDVRKWLQHADYVVQLSDSEACSYTINEALLLGTPLIVTPLPYLEELGIKDNENCYILNFDLSNISDVIEKIRIVPKFDNFKLPSDIYDKWVVKSKSKYKEELKMRYLVEALNTYEEGNIVDNELLRIPKEGEKWEVSRERLDVLLGENALGKVFVKVVEETKPKEEIKEEEKKTTKKTTKKK